MELFKEHYLKFELELMGYPEVKRLIDTYGYINIRDM